MPRDLPVLGIDASGNYCSAAVACGSEILASRHELMERGQAEALFPMTLKVLDDAGVTLRGLSAIGVGVGPGSFTGPRVGVALARGMALPLGIPSVGIDAFEVAAYGASERTLAVVQAGRGCFHAMVLPERKLIEINCGEPAAKLENPLPVAGYRSAEIAELLGSSQYTPPESGGAAVALIAGSRRHCASQRPAPMYLRDAVPGGNSPMHSPGKLPQAS